MRRKCRRLGGQASVSLAGVRFYFDWKDEVLCYTVSVDLTDLTTSLIQTDRWTQNKKERLMRNWTAIGTRVDA